MNLLKTIFDEEAERIALNNLYNYRDNESDDLIQLSVDDFHIDIHKNLFRFFKDGCSFPTKELCVQYKINQDLFFQITESFAGKNEFMIKRVLELSARRKAQDQFKDRLLDVQDLSKKPSSDVLEHLFDLSEDLQGDDLFEAMDREANEYNPIEYRFQSLKEKAPSIGTGEVIWIAGDSGSGKTAFGIQLVDSIAEAQNEDWLFMSYEMNRKLVSRRFAMIHFYENWKADGDQQKSSQWYFANKNKKGFSRMVCSPRMILSNDSNTKIDQLKAKIRYHKRRNPKLKNVLIDYFQLIPTDGRGFNEEKELADMAKKLRPIAEDLDIRVFCLSQLSRKAEDGKVKPTKAMMRGSGQLGEVGDLILGLWCPEGIDDAVMVSFLKDRNNGYLGTIPLKKYGVYFEDPKEYDLDKWREIMRNM